MGLCYVAGLVIYATYYKCDPLTNKVSCKVLHISEAFYNFYVHLQDIKAIDQLLPKFVMDTMGNYPGLPGWAILKYFNTYI